MRRKFLRDWVLQDLKKYDRTSLVQIDVFKKDGLEEYFGVAVIYDVNIHSFNIVKITLNNQEINYKKYEFGSFKHDQVDKCFEKFYSICRDLKRDNWLLGG